MRSGRITLAGNFRVQMDEIYRLFGQNIFTCREYPGDWMTLRKLNNSGFLTRVERGGYKRVNKYRINDKWLGVLQEKTP